MVHRSEEEQIELFKSWWQENGTTLIISVAVVLAGSAGWAQWRNTENHKAEAASTLFQNWIVNHQNAASPAASEELATLKTEYADTFYGHGAKLFLAQEAVEKGELEQAENQLRAIVASDPGEDVLMVSKLRLARVLYAQGKYIPALEQLRGQISESYKALYAELRGDVYMAQNKPGMAQTAYQDALDSGAAQQDTLEMKLSNARGLAGTGNPSEVESPFE